MVSLAGLYGLRLGIFGTDPFRVVERKRLQLESQVDDQPDNSQPLKTQPARRPTRQERVDRFLNLVPRSLLRQAQRLYGSPENKEPTKPGTSSESRASFILPPGSFAEALLKQYCMGLSMRNGYLFQTGSDMLKNRSGSGKLGPDMRVTENIGAQRLGDVRQILTNPEAMQVIKRRGIELLGPEQAIRVLHHKE
jgi:hypothetical protein